MSGFKNDLNFEQEKLLEEFNELVDHEFEKLFLELPGCVPSEFDMFVITIRNINEIWRIL
jgi:hypothetical protein